MLTAMTPGGTVWLLVWLGMLLVLLVVVVRRLRRRSGALVAIGITAGVLVAGLALLLQKV